MGKYEDEKAFLKKLISEKIKTEEDITPAVRILEIIKDYENMEKRCECAEKQNDDLCEAITGAVLHSLSTRNSANGKELRNLMERENTSNYLRLSETKV